MHLVQTRTHTPNESTLYQWMCNEGAAQCRAANESVTGMWESAWAYMWSDGTFGAAVFSDTHVWDMLDDAAAFMPIRYA